VPTIVATNLSRGTGIHLDCIHQFGSEAKLSDLGAAPDPRGDLQPLVNAFTAVVIGGTVLTTGRYLWRHQLPAQPAQRRGTERPAPWTTRGGPGT
jgi:hypothetical protein